MYKFSRQLKKISLFFVVALLVLCTSSGMACAAEPDMSEYDFSSDLSEDASRILSDIGVDGVDYDALLNTSPRKIIDMLIGIVSGELKQPLKTMGIIVAVLAMAAVAESFHKKKSESGTVTELFFSLMMVFTVAIPVSKTLTAAIAAIELSANFMLAYIPVFAGVVSMSGMPVTAVSYSAVTVGIAEITAQFCAQFVTGIVGIILCFVFLSSVSQTINSERIINLLKKVVTVVLSLLATVFVGMITIKGMLSAATDSVAIRGVKLIAGNAIPIVGGAIGDAYTSVLGSLGLIKNTVGTFGIVAVAAIHLPAVIELLLWYMILTLCSVFSGVLGISNCEKTLNGLASAVALINTVVIFSCVVFILTTGIILSLKS